MRFIDYRFPRFVAGGGVNTVATYLLYLLLLYCSVPYRVAYTITFLCGIAFAYMLNAWFVFRQKPKASTALAYPLVYLAQYGLGIGLLTFLVGVCRLSVRLAPLLVVAVSMPLTFILSRRVFQAQETTVLSPPVDLRT